jgi:hypothetical protein
MSEVVIPQISYDNYGEPIVTSRVVRSVSPRKHPKVEQPEIVNDPVEDAVREMKWKIVTTENSEIAYRLGRMFGMEVSDEVDDRCDGLFLFAMGPSHLARMGKIRHVPKICYWTGTDSRLFLERSDVVDFGEAIHITDSPWLPIKLSTKIPLVCFVPLPPHLSQVDIEIQRPGGIMMYLTHHPARDIERSKALIRQIPDVPVYVFHGKGRKVIDGSFQSNIVDVDWVPDEDRKEIFKQIAVHVRLMNFDGLSQTVIEMKMIGRHVFYSNPSPYCEYVAPEDSVEAIANRIRSKLDCPLDIDGAWWYRSVFSKSNFLTIVKRLCALKRWGFTHEIL